jgi:hypothetical protein
MVCHVKGRCNRSSQSAEIELRNRLRPNRTPCRSFVFVIAILFPLSFHRYECGINKLLIESGLNIYPSLTIRAVAKAELSGLLEMRDDIENRSEMNGCAPEKVYRSNDLRNIVGLVTQEHTIDDEEWLLR